MAVCSIKQCSSRTSSSVHRLPRKEELRQKWLDAIGPDKLNPRHKQVYICSLHFEESQFNRTLEVMRLRENAVPTLFNVLSTSKPVLSEISSAQENVLPKNFLPSACEMPSSLKEVPLLCETYIIGDGDIKVKPRRQVDPQKRLVKLEKICIEQRIKIKRLNEKVRRQSKKIKILRDFIRAAVQI